jgi:ribose transport system substrate-binding protein
MKRIAGFLVVASILLFVALPLFAGGSKQSAGAAGATPYRAAFITNALSNASQAFSWKEFQRFAPEFGFQMRVFAGEGEPAVEVAGIEQAIAEKYDAIFICPSNIESIIPAITRAKQAGVIVGMFSSLLPDEYQHLMDFFCGCDDLLGGRQAGQFVSQRFPNGANFVEVGGQAGHDAQIKRYTGFREGISPNIRILGSQNCPTGWNPQEAQAIMEDFITRFGTQINGVWCHWDNGATGVIQALQRAGMRDVFVIGYDGNKTGYAQVRAGTQALSVGQSFTNMVWHTLYNVRALKQGVSVPKINWIPVDMVTKETIDSFPEPEW